MATSQSRITLSPPPAASDMPSGEKGAFLFDGVKQVVWIVNYDKKTYTEMTKTDLDRMGQQMTEAMAKMQEAMKNLPPEQRAQMEQMMKKVKKLRRNIANARLTVRPTAKSPATARAG